jgi:Carboxypeptidase regulatory-like domain
MSRAIFGLVALLASAPALAQQTDQSVQTFVIQGPDGAIGIGAVTTAIQPPTGTVFVPAGQGVPVPAPGQAPARDIAQPPRTGTARIRGRAVAADSGQPLRRATIRLSSPEFRDPRSTSTDGEGFYEFRDLPSGRYTLSATKNGYVTMSYGARTWNQAGRVLTLADRQDVDRVDFGLLRGGVITGRVIDEFGDPAVGVNVQPLRSTIVNGQRSDSSMGQMATTSDTGEFRMWGLMPGDYHVLASPQRSFGPAMEITDDRTGYASTYYPGTVSAAEAQLIPIVPGQTAAGIDITLTLTRTATISGMVVDSDGQPVRRGNVSLMPRSPNGMMMGMGGGPINPDGTFKISNVAPGEYVARGSSQPAGPGMPMVQAMANISVAGADVSGVVLAPVRPIKITGRITLDPPGTWVDANAIRVSTQPKSPGPFFNFGAGITPPITRDDFTFEMSSNAGSVLIRAFPFMPGGAGSWTLKSVRYEGKEIIDAGLELSDGRDVEGVEIVLTNRQQILTGLVTNSKGEPVLDAAVTVFPQNPDEWMGPTRHVGGGRPDQNGRYSIRTLPPGEYFAVAMEALDNSRRSSDPRQFYQDLSRVSTPFTLTEGETRVVDLKVAVQP